MTKQRTTSGSLYCLTTAELNSEILLCNTLLFDAMTPHGVGMGLNRSGASDSSDQFEKVVLTALGGEKIRAQSDSVPLTNDYPLQVQAIDMDSDFHLGGTQKITVN